MGLIKKETGMMHFVVGQFVQWAVKVIDAQWSSDGESIGASFCSTHRLQLSGRLQVHLQMQLSSTPTCISNWEKLNKII